MIPEFPQFKPVELSDRTEIESFTHRFPPYSDFNFVSLLCWEPATVAWLHSNLAVRFQDSAGGLPFYSFLGTANAAETAGALLKLSAAHGLEPILRRVPEVVVTADRESLAAHFAVIAEPANADYVLSVEMMASLKSKRLRAKRQQWRRYTENHLGHRLVELDLGCPATRKEIGDVYAAWKRHKGLEGDGVATEQAALERCVSLGGRLGLVALGARLDDRLTAFTFNESLPGGWSVWHFAKADPKWAEASTWLDVESARYLHARGCNYANIAEDLGLPGLRASKRSWLPVKMLRKYRLSPCEN